VASEAPTRLLVGREALGRSDGTALVQSATSDMGPGTYTTQTMMAAYHVSVNTDIPEIETIFIEEAD
jgi:CO/xanthine dehydrogenase Mo-binding subunit